MIFDFINRYKSEYGVEPMCRVLSEHGCTIAPPTYYEARNRSSSRRSVRDEELKVEFSRVHAENYSVYGARKVWLEMRRGKSNRTTIADPQGRSADDLAQRKFNPVAPNMLWVADFTYVSTWSGWVYVAFVIDASSPRILGWRTATTMTTPLVLDAIEYAIGTRRREGISDLSGLIHHNDRGKSCMSCEYKHPGEPVGRITVLARIGHVTVRVGQPPHTHDSRERAAAYHVTDSRRSAPRVWFRMAIVRS